METLNKLIHEYNWELLSFPERYGNSVWVIIGPVINHVYQIREIKDGGDIESLELGYYFGGEGSWLPVTEAQDFHTALSKLESKVKDFVNDSDWRNAVYDAFECIMEENDGYYGLKTAVENKKRELMKPPSISPLFD